MENQEQVRFPVGGSRQAVHDYLLNHGFAMSKWSDKHWARYDGVKLHVFGTGSMARITKDDVLIAEDTIDKAMAKLLTQSR